MARRTRIMADSLDPQGPVADSIAELWWLMLVLGVAVFVLVAVVLGVGLFRRRTGESTGLDEEESALARRWIVPGGVVLPLVVIGVVLVATVATMRDIAPSVPHGALVVEIVGHQYWWEVRYPEEGFSTANELHIPLHRPVALRLTSADVIHSVWIPSLAGKLDALPDGVNTLVLEADEPGVHRSQCAEFCGLQHSKMMMIVTAEPAAAFASWVADQGRDAVAPTDGAGRRGQEAFLAECARCHTIRGTTTAVADGGPDLTHVASRPTLGAGALPNTAEDLADWVADPHASKEGVRMPATKLSQEQLADLLAYLEGLE